MTLRLIMDDDLLEELAASDAIHSAREHWRSPLPSKIAKETRSPGFAPSTVQARQVESLVALGMGNREIAVALLIEQKLLEFYYKRELEIGSAMINAKVGHVALKMAMSGNDAEMTKFWLKSRAGWKETSVVEKTIEIKEVSSARSKLLGKRLDEIPEDAVVLNEVDKDGNAIEVEVLL